MNNELPAEKTPARPPHPHRCYMENNPILFGIDVQAANESAGAVAQLLLMWVAIFGGVLAGALFFIVSLHILYGIATNFHAAMSF
jgi:hypothetical protein